MWVGCWECDVGVGEAVLGAVSGKIGGWRGHSEFEAWVVGFGWGYAQEALAVGVHGFTGDVAGWGGDFDHGFLIGSLLGR